MSSGQEDLTGVAGWAVDLMERMGPAGAGLAIALENLFPPLPSEIILPLAGFTASRGEFTVAEALLWTTAGSVVGALILLWRSFCELYVALFRLSDDLHAIREATDTERARSQASQPPRTPQF